MKKHISRRDFLKLAGGAAVTVAGVGLLPQFLRKTLSPVQVAGAQDTYDLFFAGTDGWFYLPPTSGLEPYFPDDLTPDPALFNAYIFGFRNVTGMTDSARQNQRNKAQHNAPFFWVDEGSDFRVRITNLGLALRPDLTDAHTLHWHGFRNVIPFFDGEPSGSVAVPVNQIFTYVYKPDHPGTYMYHCHVEDIEHVTMGMTGIVFVRPAQNGNTALYPSGKYAYNDGNGSTGYDREFALLLSEFWAKGHWGDSHIQESDWSEFKADYSMLNGRLYPDTLRPNSPINLGSSSHALTIQTDPDTGDMLTNSGSEHLQYNPHSSLITCNAGERVLLRFANLGFREAAMTLAGITMKVVGRDATPMRGVSDFEPDGDPIRLGEDTSYETNTLLFGAGESFDVIFQAPDFKGTSTDELGRACDKYVLYNRRYTQTSNLTDGGAGGQQTEVRVYPPTNSAGALPPQQYLNQHPDDTAA